MNMMGEGFEAPNGASALKTHGSNLNRSVTASHMALPTSARKFRTYLHRLKPEFFFSSPHPTRFSWALGVHSALRAPEHSNSGMELLGNLSKGRCAGKVGQSRSL